MTDVFNIRSSRAKREITHSMNMVLVMLFLSIGVPTSILSQVIVAEGGAVLSISSGAVVVADTLSIGVGSSVSNDGTLVLGTINNDGTLQGDGTHEISESFNNVGTFSADAGTVDYNGGGAQLVIATDYNHLIISNTGTKTFAAGTTNIAGNFTIGGTAVSDAIANSTTIVYNGSGNQLVAAMNYYNLTLAVSGTKTISSGTLGIAAVFSLTGSASADATTNAAAVDFNGATAQTVPAMNYYNLTLSNADVKTFAAGTEGIAGIFSISGTATADMTSNNSTVDYNGNGAQSVLALSYTHLHFTNSGTKTIAAGTTNIAGDFIVTGASADAISNVTSINFNGSSSQNVAAINYYTITFSNAGTKTLTAGTTGIANLFIISGSAIADAITNNTTVVFTGATLQTSPIMTYHNVDVNKSGSRVQMNDVIINNNLNIVQGQVRVTNQDFTVVGTTTIDGELRITQIPGLKTLGNIVVNTGGIINFTANSNLTLNGNLQVDGTGSVTSGSGTWNFQKSGGGGTLSGTAALISITSATFTSSYSNSGTFSFDTVDVSGTTLINNGTITVNNHLYGSGSWIQGSGSSLSLVFAGAPNISVFDASASGNTVQYSLGGNQSILVTDYFNLSLLTSGIKSFGGGTTKIGGTLSISSATADATTNLSTIEYNGSGAQNIAVIDYFNLTLSTGGTKTFGSGTTRVGGNFTVSGATADATTNTSTIEYNGSSSQTIEGMTYYNTTIDNASGVVLGGTITVNNSLTLTSGVVNTGANAVQIGASGTVSRTGGHVSGNLVKDIPTGTPTRIFEVGDAVNYTPVTVVFTGSGVSTGGDLTVSSTAGDHPQILTSGIEASLSVNRYWNLSGGSIVFDTYSVTLEFESGDVDGGATPANFIIGRYNSGWTLPTVGTLTDTTSQATGVTAFGDFQIGEVSVFVLKTWDGGGDGLTWNSGNNWNPNGVPTTSNNVDLTGAVTIDIDVAAVVNSITLNNASLVVTIQSGNSLTASGDLSIVAGTLNTEGSFPSVTGTVNISGGTVGYTNTGAQSVSAQTYNNLTLSGSGTKTFASGTTNLTGDLAFGGTAAADAVTNSATINYLGAGAQVVGAMDYYTLSLSNAGTKTFASGTSRIANTFTIGGSAAADATANTTTIIYNGSGAQSVLAVDYYHLTLATSGTKTFAAGTTGIAGNLTLTGTAAADATTNSTTITYNGSGAQAVGAIYYHHLTLDVSGTKTFASGTTGVAGNLSIGGTAAADATANSTTIAYNGTSAQSVAAVNYYNLTLTNASVKTLAAGTTGIAATLSITGGASVDAVANSTIVDYNGAAQTVEALDYNSLTLSNTGTKTLASGTTTIRANVSITGTATLDASTNSTTVEFNGTTTQTSSSATYYNVVINKVSNRLVLNDLTINGDLTITTGEGRLTGGSLTVVGVTDISQLLTVSNGSATPIFGDLVINNTGTLNISANAVTTINGNIQVDGSGTLTSGTGLWTFQKPGGGTIGGTAASVSISNVEFTSNYSLNVDLTISGLAISAANVTNNETLIVNNSLTGTGTLTQGTGSTLSISFNGSVGLSTLNATASLNLVEYISGGAQDIVATNYYNIELGNAGTKTFTSGTTGIANSLSITGSAVGDATTNSSVIAYNGSADQNVTLLAYHGLTLAISGVKTIPSGSMTISGDLQITGSASLEALTNSTTIDFNGSAPQQIAGAAFYDVTMSGGSAKTMSGSSTFHDLSVSGTSTLSDGGFQIVGDGSGSLTLATGTMLIIGNASTATLFPTNYTNPDIVLNTGSIVVYNSDLAQIISGVPSYDGLSLSSTAPVTKTAAAALQINGVLSIGSDNTLFDNGYQITGNASNAFTMATGSVLSLGSIGTATLFPTNFITANISLDAASEVIYNSNQAQTISTTPTYGNLSLIATSSVTKSVSGTLNIANDMTVGINNIFSVPGASVVNINGDMNVSGTISNGGTINVGP